MRPDALPWLLQSAALSNNHAATVLGKATSLGLFNKMGNAAQPRVNLWGGAQINRRAFGFVTFHFLARAAPGDACPVDFRS